jgi:HlyD family secretion protein
MKKKWILIIGAGVVLVVFIVIALKSNQVKKTKATVEIARKGKITSIVTATGKVKAQADVEISADVMGRIEELPVKEGQRVKTGHLLVKIDDRSRQMDVAQAKGSLLSAQSAYEKARIELNREKQLFEKQLTSQSSLDIIQNLYDQAHAQVQIYQATHDRAQDQLNKCTIRSPMNGIVTKLNSEKGENVVIGTMNNPGTVIMVVSDLSAIEIEAEVDETDIASVAVGQDVEILLDAFPDTTFKGQVIQVGNSAKASSFGISDQVTNFLVKILILDSVENIKPGMTASVDITTDYRSSDEFVRTEIKEIDGVFVCNEGKAKFAPVNTGIRDQQYVEITSGLSEGDSVVTGSYRTLRSLKHDEVIDPQKPKFGPDVEQGEGSES